VLARLVAARRGRARCPFRTNLSRTFWYVFSEVGCCLIRRRTSVTTYAVLGNVAIHENKGTAAQALSCLKLARELGVWLYRTFTPDPNFSPSPFIPPEVRRDISAELAEQVEARC